MFNFLSPYNNLLLSWILGVLTLTFKTDLDCKLTGMNEIQFYWDDIVPDLNILSSKFPIPTILPA